MTGQHQATRQYHDAQYNDYAGNAPVTVLICEDPATEAISCPIRKVIHTELTALGYGNCVQETHFDAIGIDSLDCLQLIAAVEDEYDIVITQHQMMGLETVDQLVSVVKNQIN